MMLIVVSNAIFVSVSSTSPMSFISLPKMFDAKGAKGSAVNSNGSMILASCLPAVILTT